jgi:hypothetical protein
MTALMLAAMLMNAEARKPPVRVQEITFGDDVLEGTTLSPDLGLITYRNPPKFKSLVKVRENFDDKIVRSVDQM